jgi:hypothetical protein
VNSPHRSFRDSSDRGVEIENRSGQGEMDLRPLSAKRFFQPVPLTMETVSFAVLLVACAVVIVLHHEAARTLMCGRNPPGPDLPERARIRCQGVRARRAPPSSLNRSPVPTRRPSEARTSRGILLPLFFSSGVHANGSYHPSYWSCRLPCRTR